MTAGPRLAALTLAALACLPLRAGTLEWDRTEVRLVLQPEQAQASTTFVFRNAGGRTVSLTSVDSSCGCLTARADKVTYAPGESGRIDAVFHTGPQAGEVRQTIAVATDDPTEAPTELLLAFRILRYVRVTPRQFPLSLGKRSERVISCEADSDHAIELTRVTSSLPGITFTTEVLEPGRRYRVRLESAARPDPATARILLEFTVAGVGMREVDAYGHYP